MLPFLCTGERLVGELAPELVPMLASLQQPANFVPLTNAVLAEVARRGVSEKKLVAALQGMGAEIPQPSVQMLQWAAQQSVDVRVISDCNSLFIRQMLTGALLSGLAGKPETFAHRKSKNFTCKGHLGIRAQSKTDRTFKLLLCVSPGHLLVH